MSLLRQQLIYCSLSALRLVGWFSGQPRSTYCSPVKVANNRWRHVFLVRLRFLSVESLLGMRNEFLTNLLQFILTLKRRVCCLLKGGRAAEKGKGLTSVCR
ncbi:hypothetical protein AOLI_G00076880 [Acnodon oligacanthus]